jgi:adenosine kinase
MKKVLVCGSIAYDNIMDFPGFFKEQILPDRISSLNVSFLVNSLKRQRGGTAPNIAYSLALLNEHPIVLGSAGNDFTEYNNWLMENGVDTSHVNIVNDDLTATCFITTDLSSNQITKFYPGAMAKDNTLSIKELGLAQVDLAVIAPTVPDAMIHWARECRENNIPYLFDPGMQIPRFTGKELVDGMLGAKIAIFNEYEFELMQERTGMSLEYILNHVEILIVTLGAKGAILRTKGKEVMVPSAKPHTIVTPTGAGDAFRAGLIKAYFQGLPLEELGRFGNVSAIYAVEHMGATEHKFTLEDFEKRYSETYLS